MNYQRINNITGWITFAIAAFAFLSTIEPTGSFWDCGEFIASAYKLQVGHPPGAPLFMLLGRFVSLFAGSDVEMVPIMVNSLSALASAFTILFLFWSITALAKKFVAAAVEDITTAQIMTIMGSGLVGALAYTFSDSFWFSAVEGEVYAMSSFFTAIVFWAILKWDAVADERHADRWIILIAFLMGLSIGVHLLNLLCIPALAFVYYFRKYKVSRAGIIKTFAFSVIILATIQYGIIGGFVWLGSKFDLLFVNSFGFNPWTGFLFYLVAITILIVYGIKYTHKHNKTLWNTVILCFAFILIGYSTYAQIVIRSLANPPMDENNPEDVFALLSYLNREQYGDRPLFYGQYYNARLIDQKEGAMTYTVRPDANGKKRYIETGRKIEPIYDPAASTYFPRMYSAQPNHISAYKEWAGVKGEATPTFSQNMKFMWDYQLGHMYWRYFMWNFAGRQNDIQGHGGILKGNWISGIKGLDAIRLGPQEKLPKSMTSNKGMNKLYFLPLILGLIGMVFHFKRDLHDASVVALLFFFTGIAIVLYLNGPPIQPRERDYAYVGSFYAFAIWIGIGVAALVAWLQKKNKSALIPVLTTGLCLVLVPGIMAKATWDDHDRSYRKTSRDFAHNYLMSCAPNAIIFTNGDNDTFPLWYAQEVEGIRTDVRVVNLSLLNTDWYIDQMKRKAYDSDPVPFTWTHEQYVQGTRDYVPFYDRNIPGYYDLNKIVEFIGSDRPETKVRMNSGMTTNYFPTKRFRLIVDKEAVLKNGVVKPEFANQVVDTIEWEIGNNYLMKADMMILNLLANNDWSRPIYFAVTVGSENYMNLEQYFQLEGLAYRFVPIKTALTPDGQVGRVETKNMYDNMMNKFLWGNINKEGIYLDQNNLNMAMNFRNNFTRLSESLLAEGKRDSALKVMDHCVEVFPDNTVPYNVIMLRIIDQYYRIAMHNTAAQQGIDPLQFTTSDIEKSNNSDKQIFEKGNSIARRLSEIYEDDMEYYLSLKGTEYFKSVEREAGTALAIIQELGRMARVSGQTAVANEMDEKFKALEKRYVGGM